MHTMMIGQNPDTAIVLEVLGLEFARLRHCYLGRTLDGTVIVTVKTRTGGGNRDDYREIIRTIRNHKYYMKDYEETFDNTYAHFVFHVPPTEFPADFQLPEYDDDDDEDSSTEEKEEESS